MSEQQVPGQPTEEELRAYLEELREADVAQILVQAFQVLATGAEVKLGRSDARVIIDSLEALTNTADGHLPAQLVGQMREGVRQLQLAQVQAERDAGAQAQAPAGQGAANSTGEQPGGAQQGAHPAQGPEQTGGKMTDRLWIPGREPGAP